MKPKFDINNPEHVNDFKTLTQNDFTNKYGTSYKTVRTKYPHLERDIITKAKYIEFDTNNPEHMRHLYSMTLVELKKLYRARSIPKKTEKQYKTKKTSPRLPEGKKEEVKPELWRENYVRPEMFFSDMKPAFTDIFNKQFR